MEGEDMDGSENTLTHRGNLLETLDFSPEKIPPPLLPCKSISLVNYFGSFSRDTGFASRICRKSCTCSAADILAICRIRIKRQPFFLLDFKIACGR
jgi:hypothetical protein